MDILIIGGTRYMGRIVVQRLLERGDKVTVFSRGGARPEWWDGVEHIQGDRNDRSDFTARLKEKSFDAVIDTQAYRKEDVESAVEAFSGNVGRYLMVSTGSVYLEGAVDFAKHCTFQESVVDWASIDYTYPEGEDPYGVGKRHCEKWLQENSDIPYTIIRIPAVMGWDDPTGRMWWWVQRAMDGRGVVIPLEHRGLFRTLYSADAAMAFIRALDTPETANQTYHIATQEIITIERWADLIWRAAGHACTIAYVPREVIHKRPRDAASRNQYLRDKVNRHIAQIWAAKVKRDKNELRAQVLSSSEAFQTLLDIIHDVPSRHYDLSLDPHGLIKWAEIAKVFSDRYPLKLDKPRILNLDTVYEIVLKIIAQFKQLVENNGLWKNLWHKNKPLRENYSQRLFFAVSYSYWTLDKSME